MSDKMEIMETLNTEKIGEGYVILDLTHKYKGRNIRIALAFDGLEDTVLHASEKIKEMVDRITDFEKGW